MTSDRVQADAVFRDGTRPGTRPVPSRGSGNRPPPRRPVQSQSPFRRLARTHAFMAMGDTAMFAALAGSVLALDPSGQRSRVLLYLLVSVAPFAVVAPAIGPTVDRIPGGRRMVMQITAIVRAATFVVMAFHVDGLLLYPLVFVVLVMQKTYAVSRSALVPTVVHSTDELVEANSKLSLISGVVGALAVGPLVALGKWVSPAVPLFIGVLLLATAAVAARQLPREAVAPAPARTVEKLELRSEGIILAVGAMGLIRATSGFLLFHLLFWLRDDYGLVHFGIAAAASTMGSMSGNILAPVLRRSLHEERMLVIALGVIAVAGIGAAATGGFVTAVLLALVVNFSSAIGRLAFDSIVQRDAPDANKGRAFAQFETRFQLSWVVAGLFPVAFTLPGQVGFLVVGLFGAFAATSYLLGARAVSMGKPLPLSIGQRARRGLAAERAKRRGNTPPRGATRPGRSSSASTTSTATPASTTSPASTISPASTASPGRRPSGSVPPPPPPPPPPDRRSVRNSRRARPPRRRP